MSSDSLKTVMLTWASAGANVALLELDDPSTLNAMTPSLLQNLAA